VTPTLFDDLETGPQEIIALATGVTMLKGFAFADAGLLLEEVGICCFRTRSHRRTHAMRRLKSPPSTSE
jgi:hypothetical protein